MIFRTPTFYKPIMALLCIGALTACLTGSDSSSSPVAAINTDATWPPATSSEFLAYLNGKTFKLVDYDAFITFQSGALSYEGAAGTHHTATVRQYNGSGTFIGTYQAARQCIYAANEFLIESFGSSFAFKFNITSSNDGEPYYNTNCKKPATASGVYYESATIDLIAETDCFLYDGEKFCKQ